MLDVVDESTRLLRDLVDQLSTDRFIDDLGRHASDLEAYHQARRKLMAMGLGPDRVRDTAKR